MDHFRIPALLCRGDAFRRPSDRLARHADGLYFSGDRVERRGHGACGRAYGRAVRARALLSGSWRVIELSSRLSHRRWNWFPRRERALAGGIFNSGSNIGALIAPLLVPFLATHFGWHSAFLFTGSLGLVWIAFWLLLYHQPREHPRLSPQELELIESDKDPEPPARIPWLKAADQPGGACIHCR